MVLIEKIQKIRQLRIEQDKLLQVLEFYAWLQTHGVQHDNVRGLRPLDNTVVSRGEFKCSCRRNGMMELYDELRHAYFIEVDEPNQYGYCRLRWKKVPKNYDGPEEVFVDRTLTPIVFWISCLRMDSG